MLLQWIQRVFTWNSFYHMIGQEIKFFFYFLFVVCLFRVSFIALLHDYLGNNVVFYDVVLAFVYGLKLSLKSVGMLTLLSAGISLILYLFFPKYVEKAKKLLALCYLSMLTLLFCGRIPYYEQFLSGYNQLIFNTLHDDVYALVISLIDQYNLLLRLIVVGIMVLFLYKLFVKWMKLPMIVLPVVKQKFGNWCIRGCFLWILYYSVIFVNFGGSMSYAGNVDWENSGVTKDQLLNEAILDDMQALYRAYEMNSRMESSTGLAYTVEDVREYAKYLAGKNFDSNYVDDYLRKTATGVNHQPKHIFLIVSESYANWPLLSKYSDLHLADGVKRIMERPDSIYVDTFLPNGMSTISGVMGIVTGFADANLYLTTMPEAYKQAYSTAIAPQLKRLGYHTNFWYAGPTSWEKVKDFSLAQGFEKFYSRGDYGDTLGNVWGCDDEFLYQAVLNSVEKAESSFNLVLNVSNHSPFTVNLEASGFDEKTVIDALPESEKGNRELIKQLGHFWYADKMLAEFINKAREKYPDSLFVIVGDHADRVNIDKTPTLYERYGVPLIFTGVGIHKECLNKAAVGSQIDITPTLIELIAPEGFEYYSVGQTLTREKQFGVNYGFWVADGYIGKADGEFAPEKIKDNRQLPNNEALDHYINAIRCISWWRSKYGNEIK